MGYSSLAKSITRSQHITAPFQLLKAENTANELHLKAAAEKPGKASQERCYVSQRQVETSQSGATCSSRAEVKLLSVSSVGLWGVGRFPVLKGKLPLLLFFPPQVRQPEGASEGTTSATTAYSAEHPLAQSAKPRQSYCTFNLFGTFQKISLFPF